MSWLTRNLNQTAVYWGGPTKDGFGQPSFSDGVEISVRWEDRQELFIDRAGEEVRSVAVVYVGQDMDLGGFLYLGDLGDIASANEDDPFQVAGAYEIRALQKLPRLNKATEFLRKVWL